MTNDSKPIFVPVGDNPARLFGMDARTRAVRLATNAGFECADAPVPGRAALLGNLAYAWDPSLFGAMLERPGSILLLDGTPVLAHVRGETDAAVAARAMESGAAPSGLDPVDARTAELSNKKLRKRERPFVLPLDPANTEPVERAAYDGAYKGVTDLLTLYLWRRPAFYLTRWAAQAGLSPNAVTAVGAIFCVLAFYLFWHGHYWAGTASGFVFMVLDTVDGKLARCTGQSSRWGNRFDHGIDLIHPPFWWWAWLHGLSAYTPDLGFEPVYSTMLMWAIVGGYVAQRVIEGVFMRRFNRMHIHVWKRIDSRFRLITARRNPNMVILVAALPFRRPDVGLELVALWTIVSLIFHAVRLAQATARADRGQPIRSWLEA